MRYGVCTNFLGADAYSLCAALLPELAEVFDFVELPVMTLEELGEQEFQAFRSAVLAAGADCPVMTNLFPSRLRLLAEDFDPSELDAYLDRVLPRCRALGCVTLVFGSGKARALPPGMAEAEGYDRLAELLAAHVLPRTRELGMALCLEPLHPSLCNFIHTLGEGARLARLCGGGVSLLADSLHLMEAPETEAELWAYRALLGHVHLSEAGRGAPEGQASPALEAFLRGVSKSGYRGGLSLECRMETPEARQTCRETIKTMWETWERGEEHV